MAIRTETGVERMKLPWSAFGGASLILTGVAGLVGYLWGWELTGFIYLIGLGVLMMMATGGESKHE
jgi:hypothetical protein